MSRRLLAFLFLTGAALLLLGALWFFWPSAGESRNVIVLMYHDIREEPADGNPWVISKDAFRHQLETLQELGFEVVTFDDLIAFVDHGAYLPALPLVITFDDGYLSNLTLAAPILEELNMSAIINIIGEARGKSTYRDTDIPRIPHFSFDEVRPWVKRGVIQIGHHTYDMHMAREHETPETYRGGVLQRDDETDEEYKEAFINDFKTLEAQIKRYLGKSVTVFAYPGGGFSEDTEAMLRELGVRVTLTTNWGSNVIERGNPESLFLLNRINMTEDLTGEALIMHFEMLKG